MGRFHRHDDGSAHSHDHNHDHDHDHHHDHDHDPAAEAPSRQGDDRHLGDHSGYATGPERIEVLEHIFGENDRTARLNRQDLQRHGVHAINLMSSPGAGKTALLQHTLSRLRDSVRIGVVEGDIETSIDADRLAGLGAEVALLNTGSGFGGECHLDAPMVRSALARLPLADLRLVLIENVGNLVCPAEFEVGEHDRVMIYSITEGEEKPLKYPVMFRSANLVLINKMDLLPHLDFDLDLFLANLRQVNPGVATIALSARTGAGVDAWLDWLRGRLAPGAGDLKPVPAGTGGGA
jgi:hydrogenase nickel incorporation protein HypB